MHKDRSPLAGKTVTVKAGLRGESPSLHFYTVEDWWDRLTGGSWMDAEGNPAALNYGMRSGLGGLPLDNEVLYGKIGPFGHLIHISEVQEG